MTVLAVAYAVAALVAWPLLMVALTSRTNWRLERRHGAELHRAIYPPLVRWRWVAIDRFDLRYLVPCALLVPITAIPSILGFVRG
jgi:hypothetical protein